MKLIALNWKYLKHSIWFGFALIIAGLSAGVVANSWGVVPLSLIGVGVVIVLGWLIISGNEVRGFWGRRSTQASTNALVATLAMLVILGLTNFLGARYAKRIDLTENQLFTLSPQSVEVVQAVQQPVKVWIFALTPNSQDQALLENYRRQNNQLIYEYVDAQAQPVLAEQFGVQSFGGPQSLGEVHLESGDRRNFVQTISAEERLSERSLTNGLVQLSSTQQLKVYFVQGHGEKTLESGENGLSQAIAQLSGENYVAEPLNLTETAAVPDDAAVLVIAGSQRELLEAEIQAIEDYLKRKSGLMLLLDPLTNTGLNEVLNEWGIALSDRVILDPAGQASGLGPTVALVTQYGDHPITREFGNGISFYPLSQPLGIDDKPDIEEIPLLFTSDQAQAQVVSENNELQFDPNSQGQGSLTLGVALSRSIDEETDAPEADASDTDESDATESDAAEPDAELPDLDQAEAANSEPEARVIVIGNSSFVSDGLFNQQLNGDVFLNSVNWLSQQDDQTLSIRPKEMTNRRILLNAPQQTWLGIGAVAFLPLLGLFAAFLMWWRRR